MRRLLVFVLITLLIIPVANAQEDESETIADVLATNEAEFSELSAALKIADSSLLELLDDSDANLTIFAPTNAAFMALRDSMGEELFQEIVADNPHILTDILQFHILPNAYSTNVLADLDGALVGTHLPETALRVTAADEHVQVNNTPISRSLRASNGLIYVLESVMLPPRNMIQDETQEAVIQLSIADTLSQSIRQPEPEFTLLFKALQAASPVFLEQLMTGGPYTLLAPTDSAFEAALDELGMTEEEFLADTEILTEILAYHIVLGQFSSDTLQMFNENHFATALVGQTVTVHLEDDGILINEAHIVEVDISAGNGVIHVIDHVLLPE